jgi:transcription elongation factor Elf1
MTTLLNGYCLACGERFVWTVKKRGQRDPLCEECGGVLEREEPALTKSPWQYDLPA